MAGWASRRRLGAVGLIRSLWVLLALLVGACVSAPTGLDRAQATDIQEAVFRYQFEHNASSQQESAEYYCLATKGRKDPPPELMERFAGHAPVVVPVSQCRVDIELGVSHGKVSGRGLIFNVGDIKWIAPTEVEVTGGYYEYGLSSSGNVYRLKCESGTWKVIGDTMEWIS
jgi:hypothetical protein